MTWAQRTTFGSPTRKVLMLLVADYADEDWSCYPGQATLAERTELGERTVRRLLAELEEEGWLRRERRQRPDGYRTSDRIFILRDGPSEQPATVAAPDLPANEAAPYRPPDAALPASVAAQEEPSVEPPVEPPVLFRAPATIPPPRQGHGPGWDLTFTAFWDVYPRKAGKAAARRAWDKALRRVHGNADVIVAGAMRYRDDPNREPEYTAHATTWLNQDRWEDEPLPARSSSMNRTERALRRVANQPPALPVASPYGPRTPPPLSLAGQVFALADREQQP